MADMYSSVKRSEIMRSITSRSTEPEIRVRRVLHRLGYRFRLHRQDLPGKPDIVLPRWKVAIFVHGCFWHGHDCCEGHIPKSNVGYWAPKLERNRQRDAENLAKLLQLGWAPLVVWECQTYSLPKLAGRVSDAMTKVSATHFSSAATKPKASAVLPAGR